MNTKFNTQTRQTKNDTVIVKFYESNSEKFITQSEFLSYIKESSEFRYILSFELCQSHMEKFYWEMPPITQWNLDRDFECVLVFAPQLNSAADSGPFARQFDAQKKTSDVISFFNLGGDAELVVPCNNNARTDYAHLSSFLRTADPAQVQALWRKLGERAEVWLARKAPFWISTAGLGVSWLHIRLDQRPKYYKFGPYIDLGVH